MNQQTHSPAGNDLSPLGTSAIQEQFAAKRIDLSERDRPDLRLSCRGDSRQITDVHVEISTLSRPLPFRGYFREGILHLHLSFRLHNVTE
jgi:hypothetical protein